MFESEDFDIDEDFLKDIGEKEEQYYSQINCSESQYVGPLAKRHKRENLQCDVTFQDEPDFASNIVAKSMEISANDESDMQTWSRPKEITEMCTSMQLPQIDKDIEKTRRELALEILSKGASEKNGCTMQQKVSVTAASSQCTRSLQEIDGSGCNRVLKKPGERCNKSWAKHSSGNSAMYRSAPRTTLVRKFPGPAGLLPDSHDSNLNHTNFMDRLEEHKTDIAERLDSSMSEYCSQNTEKLFSVGAWRSMLDDLPMDFLKGHEIAMIKRWARNNCSSSDSSRALFMAGVIQMIDHSVENPRLILKDASDSIEATMHRDIPLAHPNIFEPGVVILLRNVGLLGFQGSQSCPGLQFHVMIAPKNVVAVYNEKTRLVTNPRMASIIGKTNTSMKNLRSNDDETVSINGDVGQDSEDAAKYFHDTGEGSETIEILPKILGNIKSRHNRSKNPPSIPDADHAVDNDDFDKNSRGKENSPFFGTFGDDLMDSDNDTEDEILSQLDVDSIVRSYN